MKKTLLMLAALLCCCFALKAQDFTIDNLNYSITSTNPPTVALTGKVYGNTIHNLVIPSTVTYGGTTYSVTSIRDDAFRDCSDLTGSLTIGDAVTSIGGCAFDDCYKLSGTLTLGSSVTSIGNYAFRGCPLKGSLNIPNSVTSIGIYAFVWCSGFTSLTIGSSVTSIGETAFYRCSGITNIIAKPATPPTLGNDAFLEMSGLRSITVPCNKGGAYRTNWSAYASMIAEDFVYELTVASATPALGSASITQQPDCGNSQIASIIATPAANCIFTSWTENGVPASITNPYTFTMTDDRNLVANFYFSTSEGLNYSITGTNPPTVALVGHTEDFTAHDFVIPSTVTFGGTTYSVTSIGNDAFKNCSGLSGSLTIGDAVTSIGTYAFANCSNFSGSLNIGNSVTSIGNGAFENCSGFTGSLTIPNSVTSIGYFSFFRCSGLTGSLAIPNSVERIGTQAFAHCSGFNGSLTIGNSVTDSYAFSYCSGFTGPLTIGSSVTAIGQSAFQYANLTQIIAKPATPPTLGDYAFDNIQGLQTIIVPCGKGGAYGTSWSAYDSMIAEDIVYGLTVASANTDFGSASITQQPDCNTQATVLATPNDCYRFVNWTENGMEFSAANPHSFTLSGDYNLVANFIITDQYDFTAICATGQKLYYRIIDAQQHWVSIVPPTSDNENGWSGIGITKPEGDITLPESVIHNGTSYTVKAIGDYAFYHCSGLTGTLSIPNSVTSIGISAFDDCTGFTGSLIIGSSVTSIGNDAFYGCSHFTGSLTIPNSVTSIGDGAFEYCSGFTGPLTIGNAVTSIGEGAFANCSNFTGSLTIPNSVTSIGGSAFQDCSGFTGSLTISNFLTNIESETFSQCKFTGSLVIPNSVTSIGNRAFNGCSGFTGSFVIPNSVTSIGNYAFEDCTGFTNSLTIGNSVTQIGEWAFHSSGFTHIIAMPATQPPTLGANAFNNMSALQSIFVHCDKVDVYKDSWDEVSDKIMGEFLYNLSVAPADPDLGSANVERYASCDNLQAIVKAEANPHCRFTNWTENGEVVSTDNPYTFTQEGNCHLVANFFRNYDFAVTYGTSQTLYYRIIDTDQRWVSIVAPLSDDANGWDGITKPEGDIALSGTVEHNGTTYTVISIEDYAFYGCSGLTGSLTIGDAVTSIGQYAFYGCSGLTGSLNIPNSVTSIGKYAFYNCSDLTGSLTIPNSVTHIENYAFNGCSGFNGSLTIGSSVTSIGYYAFSGCSGFNGSLIIPNSVESIGDHAFYNCSGFNGSLNIPNSVGSIESYAFSGCSGFTGTLTIGASVLGIGERAFERTRFTQIIAKPVTPPTMGIGAFYESSGLQSILVPCGSGYDYKIKAGWYDFRDMIEEDYGMYDFTVTSADPELGTAEITQPATCENHEAIVLATPEDNYIFANWTENGEVVSTDNPYTFDLINHHNLVANFVSTGQYDFTAICSTGQKLYYRIIDEEKRWVSIVPPVGDNENGWNGAGVTKPEGDITLSETVSHNRTTYSVTEIGDYAFYDCSNLTGSLTIPNSVTSIRERAFEICSGFTGSLTIGSSVTTIGEKAFIGCSGFMGSLTIGDAVESIEKQAFYGCSGFTGSLTIPNSVTSIGEEAFYECSGFTGTLTIGSSVTSIEKQALYNCSGFTGSLNIPNSVTSIGEEAFNGCSGFTGSLTIGNAVDSIAYRVFCGCSGFKGSLTIGSSVTSIGYEAFYNCSGFTGSLTIPNSVTSIREEAFYGCSGFNGTLTIGSSLTSIPDDAFKGCSGFTGSLSIPNSVTSIGNYAFYNCTGFTGSLTIGSSVTSIGNHAFEGCSGFTGSLTIGNAVTSIGDCAFEYCSGFTGSLNIPNSVTSIGSGAFEKCSGFTGSLNIPNSVTSIENRTFYDCSGFNGSLIIPNSVTGIGNYAFTWCSGFTGSLIIPNSVTSIGEWAFDGCSGFTSSLTIPNSVTSISDWAFYNCSGFTGALTISNSVTSIGNHAFEGCSSFNGSLTIGSSVASIGDWAFAYCSGFTGALTIPNSVTIIGEHAFYKCTGLTDKLTIGESVTSIGDGAFAYCSGFNYIIAKPATPPSLGSQTFAELPYLGAIFVHCGRADVYKARWSGFDSLIWNHFVYSLTVASNNPELGSAIIEQYATCDNNEAVVTATPNENCKFGGWTENGVLVSTDNPYTFTYDNDCHLVANFYNQYDFSAICSTGQTLYYRIIDAEKHWVSIVAPNADNANGWDGFTKPEGDITLPETVTDNGTSYTVTEIGDCAFYQCDELTGSLSIPNSVTSIGNDAFAYCSGFNGSLTIGNSVTSIGENAFAYCSGFIGALTIPNSVTSIGNDAFAYCSGFNGSLTIGNSVTSIGENAFAYCSGFIGALTIPNSVTSISDWTFYNCSGFNGSLTIGNSVASIGENAFAYCSGFIGALTIPNSVTKIEYHAFAYCSYFTGALTIGSSVTRIDEDAFRNCNFTNIISKAQTAPALVSYIPDATDKVYIPKNTTNSYQNTWRGLGYTFGYTFIEYDREDYHFNGTGSEWNTAANWEENEVPSMPCHNAFLNTNCIFDATGSNASVHSVNVAAGKTLTIAEGKTLTADLITLENGAQFVNNGTVACNDITMKKDIEGYGEGAGNWYLVSSPVAATFLPAGMATDPADDYDLYRFSQAGDEENKEWLNYKVATFGIENQSGYLYANRNNTTIVFRGGFAATDDKELEYVANADFAGFNLVGNPYLCNAHLADGRSFYRMNTAGTELIADVADAEIAPCEGVFVQAQSTGESVTFTPSATPATRSLPAATVALTLNQGRSAAAIDRAIVRLGEGDVLGKLMLNADGTRLYIPQNGKDYAVVSTDATRGEMPLNFKAAKNGSYTITVNVGNADLNYLHLVDNLTGADVDLLGSEGDVARNVSTYTFDAKTDDYASRFKLVFGVNGDAASADSAGNFAYISNGNLVIDNIEGQASLQIIDVLGRVVSSEIVSGSYNKAFDVTPGLYILNLNGMTQKIVVE